MPAQLLPMDATVSQIVDIATLAAHQTVRGRGASK